MSLPSDDIWFSLRRCNKNGQNEVNGQNYLMSNCFLMYFLRVFSGVTMSATIKSLIHHLPIATTVVAVVFLVVLVRRYRSRGGIHLLWWAIGVFTYGAGTFLESLITLTGNSVLLNKLWYIMGALLGAYPLAQGSVYLLLQRRTANILSLVTLPFVLLLAVMVALSPVDVGLIDPLQPSGRVLGWAWVRSLTPLINIYAALFLVGGAVHSSWRYFRSGTMVNRVVGNAFIACGAILPGIGGFAARTGTVELLYLTELIGLSLIWIGYSVCVRQTAE